MLLWCTVVLPHRPVQPRWMSTRNTAKVALSTLFTRIEQSWRLCSSVKFVGLCIARSSSVPEMCNHSQGEFSAIAYLLRTVLRSELAACVLTNLAALH